MKLEPLQLLTIVLALVCGDNPSLADSSPSRLEISVDDKAGNALPCRIHLIDEEGNAKEIEGLPFWHDHFVCSGRASELLSPGRYEYAIERGPEYKRVAGEITIAEGENRSLSVTLERIADLRSDGWYCGDLHVHRPVTEIERLMQAEDLYFAPVITWWNERSEWKDTPIPQQVVRRFDDGRFYSVMAGEDEREGGALLYFGLTAPLDIGTANREFPSPMEFVIEARKRNPHVWIDIEKPFWWDVPVWLASGQMDSIGIANNHMCRRQMYESEAWGKSRDTARLPSPRGNGYWTQEIYYHLLNSGVRLPPSAGSASGVLPNPVGYNRVYVRLDQPLTYDGWFRALRQGRCFVTNGPLLEATADGLDPGATIKLQAGERRSVRIDVQLTSHDHVSQIELIRNGKVAHTVRGLNELIQRHTFEFSVDEPCWFLVRAIADVEETFRFAATAPWFVEVGDKKHSISRRSVQFFRDWVDERIQRVKANLKDESQRAKVLVWHERAREFWAKRLRMASAE